MADTTSRVEPELVKAIKLEAISKTGNPNISANDAIAHIFAEYLRLSALQVTPKNGNSKKTSAQSERAGAI